MSHTKLLGIVGLSAVFGSTSGAAAQAPDPPPPVEPWYEAIQLRAFVDAYAMVNWDFPKPQTGSNQVVRAYDVTNGFALSWVGLDASYAPDPVGGTLGLRFGPTAEIYAGEDAGTTGLANVKQAFVSWKPGGAESMLTLDFGKFDQPFGAEVADSQDNINYSRGALYWLAQPLFFTGLRATAEIQPELAVRAIAFNGWNRSIDNNIGKSYALQAAITPTDTLSVLVGWTGGPEQEDVTVIECGPGEAYDPAVGGCAPSAGAAGGEQRVDQGGANDFEAWRHLFDLVVSFQPMETLLLLANADYGVEGVRTIGAGGLPAVESKKWYGGMLGARLALDEVWAIAARGEYYRAPDGHMPALTSVSGEPIEKDFALATATLTLEAKPTDNLILRLEGRGDFVLDGKDADGAANEEIFQGKLRDGKKRMLTTTLGVVVQTN
jgi:hypothetical protein